MHQQPGETLTALKEDCLFAASGTLSVDLQDYASGQHKPAQVHIRLPRPGRVALHARLNYTIQVCRVDTAPMHRLVFSNNSAIKPGFQSPMVCTLISSMYMSHSRRVIGLCAIVSMSSCPRQRALPWSRRTERQARWGPLWGLSSRTPSGCTLRAHRPRAAAPLSLQTTRYSALDAFHAILRHSSGRA
jgi:hypothetical protein